MLEYNDVLKVLIVASLVLGPVAKAGNGNGNTGGYSGGNNGNGVGNTGPGNQGNDKQVGNANGNSSNGSNGNPNGNTGGLNGGNNGNGVGNTGPGNQGNDKPVGNACGNNCSGTTTGDVTGSTSGGEDTGATSGGESTGGTTGGTTGEVTGSTSGGETTGGETTGDTDGGTSGGDTTGGTTGGVQTTKSETKFKARLLPLVFGNYDILNKAVNQTAADERDLRNNEARLDEYNDGFLVTQSRQWDAGLGALPNLYLENASGLASLANVSIGLAPTKGRYVQYERIVSDEKAVDHLKTLAIPSSKKILDTYKTNESVYFENNGGIVFIAGAGLSALYAGGTVVADGGFHTLVKKTDRGARVEITRANLRTVSLFGGAAILKLDGTRVKQLNEGFAYEFDFARGGDAAVKVYEQLLAGNIKKAQEKSIEGVTRVNDVRGQESTKKRDISLGVPMLAIYNWASGKTYGQTATKAYADKTSTDLNYGVYFKEEKGRFLHKHKQIMRAFYATRATTKDADNKVLSVNDEANFLWSFESDSATSSSYKSALALLHKDLGLHEDFNPLVDRGQKLRFVRLEASVKIPEEYMNKLISKAMTGRDRGEMQKEARHLVGKYFADGDALSLCHDDDGASELSSCQRRYLNESLSAVNRIQGSLLNLKEKSDASSYTYAVALMGKELVRNQFVMDAFFSQDEACQVKFAVKLEGRRVSRMLKEIPANKSCR